MINTRMSMGSKALVISIGWKTSVQCHCKSFTGLHFIYQLREDTCYFLNATIQYCTSVRMLDFAKEKLGKEFFKIDEPEAEMSWLFAPKSSKNSGSYNSHDATLWLDPLPSKSLSFKLHTPILAAFFTHVSRFIVLFIVV